MEDYIPAFPFARGIDVPGMTYRQWLIGQAIPQVTVQVTSHSEAEVEHAARIVVRVAVRIADLAIQEQGL